MPLLTIDMAIHAANILCRSNNLWAFSHLPDYGFQALPEPSLGCAIEYFEHFWANYTIDSY